MVTPAPVAALRGLQLVGVDVYGDDMAGDRGDRHSRRRSRGRPPPCPASARLPPAPSSLRSGLSVLFPGLGKNTNFGFGPEWQCTPMAKGDPICVKLIAREETK
ncbi:hypothetical protein X753_14045 [Mesorhizobium sp. LNJC399B00]|uniref:hypothetical protein n=1 Tax=Mesorhizobium sp. M1406 TaxID=2957099 RepID=UPI0003CF35E9|nr:hypothetical protein X753_14045 [Mesorhizobium sp. LNJC399B00]ESZ30620.1 hypothetical protein X734_04570 [Mesorhizobium sp. L2C084A000]